MDSSSHSSFFGFNDQTQGGVSSKQDASQQISEQNDQATVQTMGKKPRTIHVAHRRSPSELTNLMRKYNEKRKSDFLI